MQKVNFMTFISSVAVTVKLKRKSDECYCVSGVSVAPGIASLLVFTDS